MNGLAGRRLDVRFLMLGGRDEAELIGRLSRTVGSAAGRIHCPGVDNDLGTFTGLIERCAVTVSGDTLAMHIALALGRRSVAIFGPTCEQEIDMFGRGEKIVTPIDCAPCYLRACAKNPNCQDQISSQTVLEAVLRQIEVPGRDAGSPAADPSKHHSSSESPEES
jgi:ADP-heptose:LPS heptosyltransferase